jgi:epoxyqueuosine reductase
VPNALENPKELALAIKQRAKELGFSLSGIAACAMPSRFEELRRWVQNGYAGQMHYIADRIDAYADPNRVLDGCRSIVMLGMQYGSNERGVGLPTRCAADIAPHDRSSRHEAGKVARYASFASDYHDVIHSKLKQLRQFVLTEVPSASVRGVVDTAPLLEREFAARAGLGWIGKNTLLLNRSHGSYFFLAGLLTDLALPVDEEEPHSYCGTCTACIDACPTEAFPAPYTLNATKCISYLTIEHRGTIAEELSSNLDGWIFGCDVCQEVCPWNRKSVSTDVDEFIFDGERRQVDVREMLLMDDERFRKQYRKTPFWRNKRRGLVRNAILLTIANRLYHLLPEIETLTDDEEPVIAEAARWAKHKILNAEAEDVC